MCKQHTYCSMAVWCTWYVYQAGGKQFECISLQSPPLRPVGRTWQIFLNLKFHQMSKNINMFVFPSVYSCSFNTRKVISPIETGKIDRKLNLLIFLLSWRNLRFWNICQVFHTGQRLLLKSQQSNEIFRACVWLAAITNTSIRGYERLLLRLLFGYWLVC